MNIYLIGMPGSGKSTIARDLGKKLNRKVIDLDDEIAKNALMFVEEIIEKLGIDAFRNLEAEALKQINEDNVIISCGGGIVTKRENKAFMNGFKIYIDTDIEIIRKRLETDYERPLLKTKTLDSLYEERFLKYLDFADVIVSNNKTLENVCEDIIEILDKEGIL